jgi:hypothetical protein
MQKHIIRTIQQEETEENKEKIKKVIAGEEVQMDVMQSITNIIIPKQTVERIEVERLSDNTILFRLKIQ